MDIVGPSAFLFGVIVFLISILPYRAKILLETLRARSLIRYLISLYEYLYAPLSYKHILSLFSLGYASIYVLARSENPYSAIILFSGLIAMPLAYFDSIFLYASIVLYFVGILSASRGNYRILRQEYIVKDEENIESVDEEAALFTYPSGNFLRLGKITRLFLRLFNVAYEPPNGLLVSLAMMVFATLLYRL